MTITPGTGALGLSGSSPVVHTAATPHKWLPPLGAMSPAGLNFDQTVQFTSDAFDIELNSSQAYLERVEFAALSAGLLDPYLVPELVNLISGGVVNEVQLHVFDKKLVSVVRGRDQAFYASDTSVNVVYSVKVGTVPTVPTSVPGFPLIPVIPGVTVPLTIVAAWRASQIAQDLCRRVGLTCVWEAHDYLMREDTVVNGPILPAIQRLIEPFSHFERSKTDIWVEGRVMTVRARQEAPSGGVAVDAHDARIIDLVLRARYTNFIRLLKLTGSRTGTSPYVSVDPGDQDFVTENETLHPVSHAVTARTITTRTVRKLDNACKREVVETYRDALLSVGTAGQFQLLPMHLVARETTVSDWDDLALAFPNVILNKPKENSRVTTREIFDPNGGSSSLLGQLVPQTRTSIMNDYDGEGYVRMQDTRKEVWDLLPGSTGLGKTWVLSKMETKKYDRNGAGMYQITTTQYGSDGVAGDSHRTIANGTPPGGPGRGSAGGSFEGTPISYGILISQQPGAKDITIDNPNLLLTDLLIIAAQARAASGATEVEINFTAAGMPWIKRGQFIHLTNLFAEDGTTPIATKTALVSEARVEYREQGEEPTYLTYVKALYWDDA